MLTMVQTLHPNELWHRYSRTLGLEHDEYLQYVDGREHASALALENTVPLRPVPLHKMRELKPNFHPPQFYLRLCDEGPLIEMLERHLQLG